jgi:ADP-ribose pyrophosphatase YjhB (NUDIX family)
MPRAPIPTWFYAVVVVRRGDRFLLVQEASHGNVWYLPAGRVEAGERLEDAAHREALEETGVPVVLEGILRVQHTAYPEASRVRVVFVARPADDRPPKTVPDADSLQARWVTLEELDRLPLRGPDVREFFAAVAGGATVAPLTLLEAEE